MAQNEQFPPTQLSQPRNPYYQPKPNEQVIYVQQQPINPQQVYYNQYGQPISAPIPPPNRPPPQIRYVQQNQGTPVQETTAFLDSKPPRASLNIVNTGENETLNDSIPGDGNDKTTSTFGERMSYDKPKYQDVWAMVCFWIHVLVVIGVGIYFWVTEGNNVNIDVDIDHSSYSGFYVAVAVAVIVGIIFGFMWLKIMICCAGTIIKTMLFVNIGIWIIVVIISVLSGMNMGLLIVGILGVVISGLYTYCVWNRIPFATALLTISSSIVSKYPGVTYLSLTVSLLSMLWLFIWFSMVAGYLVITGLDEINSFVMFIMFVSFFWGEQVWKNVSHTTTCGVAATWYFAVDEVDSPVCPAFKRTMTTSFGSVAFGSLIVAILEALRAIVESQRNSNNGILVCVVACLLECIKRLIEWFNKYAYAHVGIYGTSFIESAKNTWKLLTSIQGLLAIINDDLTSNALICGSFLAFLIGGGISFGIGYAWYGSSQPSEAYVAVGVIGGIIALVLCFQILYCVASSIICMFVCFAEDPNALKINHPEEYTAVTGAKPEMETIANGGELSHD